MLLQAKCELLCLELAWLFFFPLLLGYFLILDFRFALLPPVLISCPVTGRFSKKSLNIKAKNK